MIDCVQLSNKPPPSLFSLNLPHRKKGIMSRKKTGLENTAFQQPFYKSHTGSNVFNIPEEYETLLIELYTKITEETECPDITKSQLPDIFKNEFGIPEEIIPVERELEDWVIEGTDVIDFEKWLYNGYFWLLLRDNVKDVDMLWRDTWASLESNNEKLDLKEIRKKKMYLNDITKLIKIGKLDANAMGMLQSVSNGKVFITFVDFFILLGRLGVFN